MPKRWASKDDQKWAAARQYLQAYAYYKQMLKEGHETFSTEVRDAWAKLMTAQANYKRVAKL